jgi:MFS transporter, DHA1 family, inner membrane transport protein
MTRTLNLIAFVVFGGVLFMRVTDPVIPKIAHGLAVDPATAALLSSAFTLAYALPQPLIGALADMFSKARLMLLSLLVLTLATIVGGLAPNFQILFAARIVGGLASGGIVPAAFAFVGDAIAVEKRQVAMGRVLFAIMSANLLSEAGAGVVGDLFDWRGVFFAASLIGLLAFVAAVPGLWKHGATAGGFDLRRLGPDYRTIFKNPLAKICFGAVFLEGCFMYGVFPYIATMLHQSGETLASIAGIVIAGFGVGGALYGLTISRLLAWLGEQRMMRYGGVIMGLCLLIIAAGVPWPLELIGFALLGFGFYMLHGVIQIYASELAPQARGSAMALHTFFYFIGQALGPVIYGLGFNTIGIRPVLVVGAGVLVGVGFTCAQWLRREAPAIR